MQNLAPGALVADPDYYGSLAAVRDLGRVGIAVAVADHPAGSKSASSRYCQWQETAPPTRDRVAFLAWLKAFGQRHPGWVLYPTSDDLAWLMAAHQDELRPLFRLYQPPASAVLALVDKAQMHAHALAAGLRTPLTFSPTSMADVRELALRVRAQDFPLIVKPRTQTGTRTAVKGLVAQHAGELEAVVGEFLNRHTYQATFLEDAPPDIVWPLLQQFLPDAQANTHSLSGFIDASGALRTVRACVKLYQQPVKVGVGIAFESRAVVDALAQGVERMARATGYFGVFEAEFIHVQQDDQYFLMDFNPRYYGQMHFATCRGMSLAQMVHAAAHGDVARLDALVQRSEQLRLQATDSSIQHFCNRWLFRTLLWAQRLKGALSAADHRAWHRWMHTGQVFDFVFDPDDPEPWRTDQRLYWRNWLCHPRASFRELFQ